MTNVERAFIHQLAQTMGLKSKSDGKGEDRFLTVTKKGMTIISIHINLQGVPSIGTHHRFQFLTFLMVLSK